METEPNVAETVTVPIDVELAVIVTFALRLPVGMTTSDGSATSDELLTERATVVSCGAVVLRLIVTDPLAPSANEVGAVTDDSDGGVSVTLSVFSTPSDVAVRVTRTSRETDRDFHETEADVFPEAIVMAAGAVT